MDWNHHYGAKLGDLRFKYRLKFQFDFPKDNDPFEYQIRNKLTIEYKVSKNIRPYVEFEPFYVRNYELQDFDQYRIGGGLEYRLNKRASFEFFFKRQNQIIGEAPRNRAIYGVAYAYQLKKWKKKKKDKDK